MLASPFTDMSETTEVVYKNKTNSRLIRDLVLVPSTRDSLDIRLVLSVVFKGGKQKIEDQSAPQCRASTLRAPPGG